MPPSPTLRLGIISDTHGLLRPEAVAALRGVDHILHAGDVGKPEVLEGLRQLAPVTAIRGNVDKGAWAEALPATEVVTFGQTTLYLLHDRQELDLDPAAAGFAGVIYGHSHKPWLETREGVLYLNPGAAGHRRFNLPITLAYLDLGPSGLRVSHLDLMEEPPTVFPSPGS